MNLSLFLQQLKHASEKGLWAVSRRWVHALGSFLTRDSMSRRSAAHGQSLRTEPFEVRQVLSAISPLTLVIESAEVDSAPGDAEGLESLPFPETHFYSDDLSGAFSGYEVGGDEDNDVDLEFTRYFREQLLAAIDRFEKGISADSGFLGGDGEPAAVDWAAEKLLTAFASSAVVILPNWDEGSLTVAISVGPTSQYWIEIHGLGSTPLATMGLEQAEAILLEGVAETFQTVQPSVASRILIQEIPEGSLIQGILGGAESERTPQEVDPVLPSRATRPDGNYRSQILKNATGASDDRTEATVADGALDQVFQDTVVLFSDDGIPVHGAAVIGHSDPVLIAAAAVQDTALPLKAVPAEGMNEAPGQAPLFTADSPRPGSRLSARLDSPKAQGHSGRTIGLVFRAINQMPANIEAGSRSAASSGQRPGEPRTLGKRLGYRELWFGLLETGLPEYVLKFEGHDEPAAHTIRVVPPAVPVNTESTIALRDGQSGHRQSFGFATQVQVQSKKLRENQRQNLTPDPLQIIAIDDFKIPVLPSGSSIPREMKYVANPRGPPKGVHFAVVPHVEIEAPVNLLERLRYSIAPRGPSLVAAEMQSPECQYFSGPRTTSEEPRLHLVC